MKDFCFVFALVLVLNHKMGKPLSRPDCLRQSPRCLGKGDEDETYIEDCYVPQRSIYDTMRINEQIDQGTKLCQPSRSTLGSGGEVRGEESTISSNGTIGADLGSVFISRGADHSGGVRKLDERVIFDALKLTGDAKVMSPPVVGSGLPIVPSSSGAAGVVAVCKRRHQGGDKKDNLNRRSWKAFFPPTFPDFTERLEFPSVDGAEKRSSGAGIPLPPPQPNLSQITPTSSTPTLPPHTPSPLSSAPHTPPVSISPALTPAVSPQQRPLSRQKQVKALLQKQMKPAPAVRALSKEPLPAVGQTPASKASTTTPQQSPSKARQKEVKREEHRRTASSSKASIRHLSEDTFEAIKTSDSERDSPLLDQNQGDNTPLIPPKPVFCPPTKARTWPRGITTGKKSQISLRHNFPILPPLPPLLGEDNSTDEESVYLLDPPSPFLKEEEESVYGGLPLSPCVSHEGDEEGLLGWSELRERTASELKFEEDERRILEELEEEKEEVEEKEDEWKRKKEFAEEERAQREEREWEAVLKLDNRERLDQSWGRDTLESERWDLTGSSGHWPLLTPPSGFGGPGAPSASPCPSSVAESDDLFLELERQCEEGVEMSVDPEPLRDPYTLPCLEEEEEEEEERGTLPLDAVHSADFEGVDLDSVKPTETVNHSEHIEENTNPDMKDHDNEHRFIDDECDLDYEDKTKIDEEEMSCPTDSAIGQHLESDSSGVQISQTGRTATDSGLEKTPQPETDLDSGASSQPDEESASSPSRSPLNPYAEEEKLEEQGLKQDEELGTEWDVCDQSEPGLDGSVGALVDDSLGPRRTAEQEVDGECTQDVDALTSCQEELISLNPIEPRVEITSDTEGTSSVSENLASGLDEPERAQSPETTTTISTPESDSAPLSLPQHSAPSSSSPQSDSCGSGLDAKDSEAFVTSDSFVYLAVSVPPQYLSGCPPSPVGDSIPPSPIPKPACSHDLEESEDGSIVFSDSFVYMAAPERPQPGRSELGSACEDAQELDLDSYSEGTQSGLDGVEFILGSMTGDSDWESDSSALEFPPVVSSDQVWDQLEPGLLQSLFSQPELSQVQTGGSQKNLPQMEAFCSTETEQSSDEKEPTGLQSLSPEASSEVCFIFKL